MRYGYQRHDFWDSLKKDLIAYSAAVQALLTLTLAGVGIWQLVEIHSGSKDTHDLAVAAISQSANTEALANSAKEQAKALSLQVGKMQEGLDRQSLLIQQESNLAGATEHLAVQAAESTKLARDSLQVARTAERPWMSFESLIGDEPTQGKRLDIRAVATNVGRSPALVVALDVSIFAASTFPTLQSPREGLAQSVIGPGQKLVLSNHNGPLVALSDGEQRSMTLGKGRWYIVSQITYKSLLDNTIHSTQGCAQWQPERLAWISCSGFNKAD